MTLQQIEYVVALYRTRHFAKAAESCGVTQPTLSAMISKLEEELEVKLFDRKRHPIEPTTIGKSVVDQALKAMNEVQKIREVIDSEANNLQGSLKMAILPTIAPYLIPKFIKQFKEDYAEVKLNIIEGLTNEIMDQLIHNEIDMAIVTTPLEQPSILEVPLYYEKFVAYFSADERHDAPALTPFTMPLTNLWSLQEGHCTRKQIFNFCSSKIASNQIFEAGSMDTLIRIVDVNGGYTVIPEMHLDFLTDKQRSQTVEIKNPPAVREVSVVFRADYVRERLVNAVANTVKKVIPEGMLDERLKKFSIRLK